MNAAYFFVKVFSFVRLLCFGFCCCVDAVSSRQPKMFLKWIFHVSHSFPVFLVLRIRLIVASGCFREHRPKKNKFHDFLRRFLPPWHSFCCNSTTIHQISFLTGWVCRPRCLPQKCRDRLLKLLQGLRSKFDINTVIFEIFVLIVTLQKSLSATQKVRFSIF